MTPRGRIVLIPGFGLGPSSWDPLLAAEPFPNRDVVRLTYQHQPLVDDHLAQLAERLSSILADGQPTHVVAFSLGTAVLDRMLRLARPEALLGAVAIGGVPGPEQATDAYRSIADQIPRTHDHDTALADMYANTEPARHRIRVQLSQFPLALRQGLAAADPAHGDRARVPWLFLFGTADRILVPPTDEAIASSFPGAAVERIAGGHAVHLDAPQATAAAIGAWLRTFEHTASASAD